MKKFFLAIFVILAVLIGILAVNYFSISSRQAAPSQEKTDITSIQGAEARLSKAITFPTVSFEDSTKADYAPFVEFHKFLQATFPAVYDNLEVEMVNGYSLLFHWKGSDDNLKPVILMAHQDVVPVSEDSRSLWTVPPFEGIIKDGYLWGRGSIDDKSNLMGQLEAVNFLVGSQFKPKRDIYLAFGHDEELGGERGALKIAQLLKSRGVEAEFVLDEGGIVTDNMVPGVSQPVALIGTSEKGYLDLTLSVRIEGGHSSMPKKDNAIGVMSKALTYLANHPFDPQLSPSVRDFFSYIGPHSSFINRLAISNMWLFKPVLFRITGKSAAGDAMIRSTMVPTIIHGGDKSNVVPDIVTANVNLRLLPGTTIQDAIGHVRKAINNPDVKIEALGEQKEAGNVAPTDNDAFRYLSDAVYKNFPNTLVSPFLMIGGTDSKHFEILSASVYKFSPLIDPIGFHGVDERLNLKEYPKAIGFYVDLIKSL